MARLVSFLLRASRGSSGGALSAAAGVGIVRRSCPIAVFRPQRCFTGEDASSEHALLRRSIHEDPRRPFGKVDSSSGTSWIVCWIVFLHEPSPTFAPNLPATHGAIPTCEGSKLSPYGGMRYVKPLASDMVWVIETSMHDQDDYDDDEFVATEKDLASDEAMWALYQQWCEYFCEERDPDEMVRRFPRFKETVLRVHEVNSSNLPYKLEINEYADMKILELTGKRRLTEEDFARYRAQGLVDESHLE
ncbi:hypothetical protein HU200_010577 [Digitaria exilis]|uniref:Cathepsin propeptide inhibitor domain-containing protein n=1 Tax=Digitaria exilis TaxID=1010633 RepID=A0A835FIX1_9POAL|nr:hypothetical protein HU200_010577 [Digitaria exilis]